MSAQVTRERTPIFPLELPPQRFLGMSSYEWSRARAAQGGCVDTSGGVSIDETYLNNAFELYPNPVSSILNIEVTSEEHGGMEAVIRNYQGKLVVDLGAFYYSKGATLHQINLEVFNLSDGIYYLDMQNGGYHVNKKFIYQK